MRPPSPRYGRLTINIEQLIVSEELLAGRRTAGLREAIERELGTLLEQAAEHEFAGGSAPSARAPAIEVSAMPGARQLGRQIAESVFASIVNPS